MSSLLGLLSAAEEQTRAKDRAGAIELEERK
jgi:hypothetical protein